MADVLERLSAALADRYRLERELGAGGMATVYLSEDLRHHRRVAVKVLRPELAAVIGAERFLSEITTTANLQHPHILPLFDSGEADGFLFYVMPYVQGETVRDRLTRERQLPIADAVRIATEVAQALDYAHRHNVIHRDIKPENILLHDGSALVADFGIALAASKAGGARMTETGMSLGTPHYMSPEQAMGEREITARSDVYALGCVLYEMLVGEPPFTGPTAQAIIARVVTEEPRSLTIQRKTIPRHIEAAVEQALQKLPADRFATAAEFVAALQGKGGTMAMSAAPQRVVRGAWRERLRDPVVLGLGVVALVAGGVAFRAGRRPSAPAVPPLQFVMASGDSTRPFNQFPWPAAISPNGDAVVYSVPHGTSTSFYLLRTDQLEAHPIPGTANASQPVFSPDGAWIAFGISDLERKVRLDGGAPVTITATHGSAANGATWTTRNEIVLGAHGDFHGLTRVSVAGGEEIAVTTADSTQGALDHVWPIAFPDGKTIAFAIWSGSLASSQLALTSLDDGRVVPLGLPGIRPVAVLDGVLVYVQADGAVMGIGIDVGGRKSIGRPLPLHDPVPVEPANNGNSGIYISNGGAMVTARGGTRGRMAWITADGRIEPILPEARGLEMPRLSPDERRIAVVANEASGNDVWIHDRTLGTFSRLTSSGSVTSADWSADGARIVYTAGGGTQRSAVWVQDAGGASPATMLFESPLLTPVVTASPDGKDLLVNSLRGSSWDINRVTIGTDSTPHPYVATLQDEQIPTFSPDGRWVALMSRESGRYEIYLRSYPDPSVKMQVSISGGERPVWSPDGLRLYYQAGTALLAARLRFTPSVTLLGRDTILSKTSILIGTFNGPAYDVSRTGRILGILPDANDFELVIAPNWITEFRRLVAESKGEGQ